MATAKITIFPDKFKKFARDPGGPLDRASRRAAEAILRAARNNIESNSVHTHPGRNLADSGQVVRGSDGNWIVAFNHRAARIVHEGARPHIIVPRGAKVLILQGKEGETGSPVFRPGASHPGVRTPNRYLVDAARSLGLTIRRSAALSRPPERLTARLRSIRRFS